MRYSVVIQNFLDNLVFKNTDKSSALTELLTATDVTSRSDFMAINTPPPDFLYLLGFFGSGGCDNDDLSFLNTL